MPLHAGHLARHRRRRRPARRPRPENLVTDEFAPILSGPGGSDYERYLRTDELLSLQKSADEWVHRDELLFQTVHQSSELWPKHAWNEVEEAARSIELRALAAAQRLPRRANAQVPSVSGFL